MLQILGLSTLATSGPNASIEPTAGGKGPGGESDRGGELSGRQQSQQQQQQQQQLQQLLPLQHQPTPMGSIGAGGLGGLGEGPMLTPGVEGLDRGMFGSVLRAFRALEASAVEGDHMLSRVRGVWDRNRLTRECKGVHVGTP
eukprot:586516-Pelagomonas_calceolata.AAC.3